MWSKNHYFYSLAQLRKAYRQLISLNQESDDQSAVLVQHDCLEVKIQSCC